MRKFYVQAAASVLAISCHVGVVSAQAPNTLVEATRAVVNPANGHAYEIVNASEALTWQRAREAAASRTYKGMRGHLATLTSEQEVKFAAQRPNSFLAFIGAYQDRTSKDYKEPAGGWRWVTGESFEYSNWNTDEPNNANNNEDNVILVADGKWNDYGFKENTYLVEYEAEYKDLNLQPSANKKAPTTKPSGVTPKTSTQSLKSAPLTLPQLPAIVVKRANYNPANGHHYEFVATEQPLSWHDAAAAAAARRFNGVSGHLVTFSSIEEVRFVAQLQPHTGFWIGAYQDRSAADYREPSDGWRWVNGEAWSFTNWNRGEPNNAAGREDFVVSTGPDGGWNDVIDPLGGYIVEYDTKPRPAGSTASPKPQQEALDFLAKVRRKYQTFNSYSETIELRAIVDVYRDEVESARAEFTWEKPNRFRLVGVGEEGRVTAVGDGQKLFMIDRTAPDMYVLRDMPALGEAVSEALRIMTDGFAAPVTLGFLDSSSEEGSWKLSEPAAGAALAQNTHRLHVPASFDLIAAAAPSSKNAGLPEWTQTVRLGEVIEGRKPAQTVYADLKVRYANEPGIKASWKLTVSLDDMLVRSSELRFRYDRYPLIVTERHENIEINPKIESDEFEYSIPANADRVKRLRSAGEVAP